VAKPEAFRHVNDLWDDRAADVLDPVGQLIYRSNLLGIDQRITNTGGGNTSVKLDEADPMSGERVPVLWVKGSGGDLRTATRMNFASVGLRGLLGLERTWQRDGAPGPKTPSEDAMVARYALAAFNLNPCAPSIDTPLHGFVPVKHVDHTHPNAVIAVAASARGEQLTREIYGDELAWLPWQRPGFDLGLRLREAHAQNPRIRGAILGQHGLINWAQEGKECYELSLALIEKAARFIEARDKGDSTFGGAACAAMPESEREELLFEILPWLRGRLSETRRVFATVQATPEVLRFVNSKDASRLAGLGTSCPDHFLRTKIKPLLVGWDPASRDAGALRAALERGLEHYRRDYAAYYEKCKRADSPAMRDPNPTVVLIPGVGMLAFGKTKSESRVTAEFYTCAVEVMRGAEAIDTYVSLPQQEAFDIEYWLLEEAKLKRMPAEREMSRTIAVVVGAGSGIGRTAAARLAREGAHVVCADRALEEAKATAEGLTKSHGAGIGVAGSGISACGPAVSLGVDLTDRTSIRDMLKRTILAYGGLDSVIVTAGLYASPDEKGNVPDQKWRDSFDVNVIGAFLVADECRSVWQRQGLRTSLVLTTSVNGVVSKRGSLAYDTSKAAANHLTRELAIDMAPLVRVNAVAPATVVEGSSMFPRDRVVASLAKYKIPYADDESTDVLRAKLADFYAQRTLTKQPVTTDDQAEAIFFLSSERSARTTGQILCVDGGLHEAFLR